MCRRVQCGKCGKATFAGCGMHVEQVLGGVPESERCQCAAQKAAKDAAAPGKKSSPRWWPF